MGSIQNTIQYCCVARGNKILYAYGHGDQETDNLASLCLEKTPPFHKWYIETIGKRTFCFLIEDGQVYLLIANENFGSTEILQFLERFRDEFKKVTTKKGSRGSFPSQNTVEDHLVPVIRRLIASLESAPRYDHHDGTSPSPNDSTNGVTEISSSTKAPLLGKSHKQETTTKKKKKKKTKDHVITVRDSGLEEEHRKSTDRGGANSDSASVDLDSSSAGQSGASSLSSLQKDSGPSRIRPSPQSIRKKWWRQVRIVLAIDAVVCLVLFVIWLGICRGINCVR